MYIYIYIYIQWVYMYIYKDLNWDFLDIQWVPQANAAVTTVAFFGFQHDVSSLSSNLAHHLKHHLPEVVAHFGEWLCDIFRVH